MSVKTEFNFKFKGNRNYIQGGDIFDALEASFSESGKHVVTLSFRHFSSHQLQCVFDAPDTDACADGQCLTQSDELLTFWLVETAEPVTDRYEFDEKAITGHARVNGRTISAEGTTGYSVIEQVIALTKVLNYARAPDVDGKWVFGQLRLTVPLPPTASHIRIYQKALLANRFSTQEIHLDKELVGEIRFIVGSP